MHTGSASGCRQGKGTARRGPVRFPKRTLPPRQRMHAAQRQDRAEAGSGQVRGSTRKPGWSVYCMQGTHKLVHAMKDAVVDVVSRMAFDVIERRAGGRRASPRTCVRVMRIRRGYPGGKGRP